MIKSVEVLNRVADGWAATAWAVAWQSALLVAAFAILASGLRRSSPALRYWLWQIAAIKLVLMPLWIVPVALPGLPSRSPEPPSAGPSIDRPDGAIGGPMAEFPPVFAPEAPGGAPPAEAPGPWSPIASVNWRAWLLLAWGLAVVVQAFAIARQYRRLKRLLRRARPADNPALLGLVAELAARIGLRRPPEILLIDGEISPFVCGLRRPRLVLPGDLARVLDPDSMRSVLLHELAHLRRRDLVWDWLPTLARLLYVVHPAAHFVADRVRLERELACDQAAMVLAGRDASGYASTLVEVVSRSSAPPSLRAALLSAGFDGAEPQPAPARSIDNPAP